MRAVTIRLWGTGFVAPQFLTHYRFFPADFGVGLAGVYLAWIAVIVVRFPRPRSTPDGARTQ